MIRIGRYLLQGLEAIERQVELEAQHYQQIALPVSLAGRGRASRFKHHGGIVDFCFRQVGLLS